VQPDKPKVISQALLSMTEKTFFTPHLGSAVDDVRREITLEAARNILQALNGEVSPGAVNRPNQIKPLPERETALNRDLHEMLPVVTSVRSAQRIISDGDLVKINGFERRSADVAVTFHRTYESFVLERR